MKLQRGKEEERKLAPQLDMLLITESTCTIYTIQSLRKKKNKNGRENNWSYLCIYGSQIQSLLPN